jgi:chemotaxis signal transduction protein
MTAPLLLSAVFLVAFLVGAASGALWRHWARVRAVRRAEAGRQAATRYGCGRALDGYAEALDAEHERLKEWR